MRTRSLTVLAIIGLCLAGATASASAPVGTPLPPSPAAAANAVMTAPMPFLANQGELSDDAVRYYVHTFAGSLFVTRDGQLVYAVPQRAGDEAATWAFRETFAGSQPISPAGDARSPVRVSTFKGPDPTAWHSAVPAYDTVDVGEAFPGVRVSLRAAGSSVEKLFHVAPGGDVGDIDIAVAGVDRLAIDGRGRLVLATDLGEIPFSAPVAYQLAEGGRHEVPVAYELRDDHHYGFRIGAYDHHRELVIDPLLEATYLGGHNPSPPGNYDDDVVLDMVVSDGDVWLAGVTQSPDFPIHLGWDPTLPNAYPDGFITRMSGDLTTVIASTYVGTDGFDRVTGIARDSDGSIVVTGEGGYGFPVTPGAYTWSGSTPTGGGFVARFSADLGTLEASAIPTPGDYPVSLALGNGGVYFGGSTNSPSFPITPGAWRTTCCPAGGFGIREYDGFAGELSSDLTTLVSMTYLGNYTAKAMAVSPDGTLYIADGFDYGISGYLARFDGALTNRMGVVVYDDGANNNTRTYFNDVAVGDGSVVAVGETYITDLPATAGAFDTTCGTDGTCDGVGDLQVPRSDAFVARFSTDLQSVLALTYLGGSDFESARSVALGPGGDVFVAGETTSVDFPTAGDGADTECGFDGACDPVGMYSSPVPDGFVAHLSADLSSLLYGSYLGGAGEDRPTVVTLADDGSLYLAGWTDSTDFPATPGAFDETYNGGTADAFIAHLDAGAGNPDLIFAADFEHGDMLGWSESVE